MSAYLRALRGALLLTFASLPALAQQPTTPPPTPPPVLGAPPQPGPGPNPRTVPTMPGPAPVAPGSENELIGQTYAVELRSGTSFIGVLTASSPEELRFQTRELGLLVIQRVNIRQLSQLTAEQARRGYDYQGNGNRLFFAPTARNLRRGEGTVQTIDIFLLGVNYGITDHISLGALFTWVPEAGSDNFFALTPKVSFPVNERLHVGGGALIAFTGGDSFTLAYANTTYGSADNNVTAGVGYAFVRGEYINTPVLLLGGARRVSRRVSLLNESYILSVNDHYERYTLVGGLAGLRVAGQRLSGSLGLMYGITSYNSHYGGGSYTSGGAYPFAEATLRFGRVK